MQINTNINTNISINIINNDNNYSRWENFWRTIFRGKDFLEKSLGECTDLKIFNALVRCTNQAAINRGYNQNKKKRSSIKKLYYLSAEFLIGKLLSNNLINLGMYDQINNELATVGKSFSSFEEMECEPSNCESFMRPTGRHFTVNFGDFSLTSTLYEITITGYRSKCGKLRLFDVDSTDEKIIGKGIEFNKSRIDKALTLFLYPDDSDDKSHILRVYQEYFMVANAAQLIVQEAKQHESNSYDLAEYAAVQINDTHPPVLLLNHRRETSR
ncbi:MAG: glycogen/starch/alpha-glucan phosphorylase [Olegusella sp.]|nr:glycogen/starch/alpha-glucan phosphorylase [Olegusella sp.]